MFPPSTLESPKTATLTISSVGAAASPVLLSVTQDQPDVVIYNFTSHASSGSIISIDGTGFSFIAPLITVKINGVIATVTSASPTTLSVIVLPKVGSGPIEVTVNTTVRYDFL